MERFKAAIEVRASLKSPWEDGYFRLAQYYDLLLSRLVDSHKQGVGGTDTAASAAAAAAAAGDNHHVGVDVDVDVDGDGDERGGGGGGGGKGRGRKGGGGGSKGASACMAVERAIRGNISAEAG